MTTDISVTTVTHQVEDRSWLQGPHGTEPGTTPSVTLNIPKFTQGTHFPNGYIKSGIVIGKVTADGTWGPFDSAATDGREVAANARLLFSSVAVRPGAVKVGGASVIHAFVDSTKLPHQSGPGGITPAAKTALSHIIFTA